MFLNFPFKWTFILVIVQYVQKALIKLSKDSTKIFKIDTAGARSTFALRKSIILTMASRVVKLIMSRSNLKSQMNAAEIFRTDFLTQQNKELEAAAMAELLTGYYLQFIFLVPYLIFTENKNDVRVIWTIKKKF